MLMVVASRIVARTTLDIDASIIRELRRRNERERKSMGQIASELPARALRQPPESETAEAFRWTSADLGVPTVDLDDAQALDRVLDGRA